MNELHDKNYSTLKENPIELLKLVDKHVKIDIIKNCSFIGFVHSFDPVSHSIILFVAEGDTFKPTLIPGHAVLNIAEVTSLTDARPIRMQAPTDSIEDITIKRTKLMAWFKSNLLPATEFEDRIELGNVTVLPPYNGYSICANNPIVATQIKRLMELMPQDFNSS